MSAPVARTESAVIALTVPAVPTGMNAGVAMSPCAVARTPVRAAPSVAVMRWENVGTIQLPVMAGGPAARALASRSSRQASP